MITASDALVEQLRAADEALVEWQHRVERGEPILGAALRRSVDLVHQMHHSVAQVIDEFKEFET